jgi:hypothetical protein
MSASHRNKQSAIPVRLDPDDAALLEDLKAKTGIAVSTFIRAAVRLFLDYVRKHEAIPISTYDANKTLEGEPIPASIPPVVEIQGASPELDPLSRPESKSAKKSRQPSDPGGKPKKAA